MTLQNKPGETASSSDYEVLLSMQDRIGVTPAYEATYRQLSNMLSLPYRESHIVPITNLK